MKVILLFFVLFLNFLNVYSQSNNSIAHIDFNIENTHITEKKNIDKALKEYDSLLNLNEEIIEELKKYKIPNYSNKNNYSYRPDLYHPYNSEMINFIKGRLKPFYDRILNDEAYLLINRNNLPYSKKNKILFNMYSFLTSYDINDSLLYFVTSDNLISKEIQVITTNYNNYTDFYETKTDVERFRYGSSIPNKIIRNLIRLTKKNKSDVSIKNEDKEKIARTFTGIDKHFLDLLLVYEAVNERLMQISKKFIIQLNSNYFYFGEKKASKTNFNPKPSDFNVSYYDENKDRYLISSEGIKHFVEANGYGYIIFNTKKDAPIVLSGYWEDGYPIEIMDTSLYSEMPYNQNSASLKLKKYNYNNQFHIDENGLIFGENQGDVFHGTAFRLWKNGTYFYGTYQNGSRTEGLITWKNGDKYNGSFNSSNDMHGYGTYYWNDGSTYVGEWKNSNRSGYGIRTSSNGTVSEGIWENNAFIKSKSEIEQERIAEEQRIEQERLAEEQRRKQKEEEDDKFNKAINKMILEALTQPSKSNKSSKSSSGQAHSCAYCSSTFKGKGYDMEKKRINGYDQCKAREHFDVGFFATPSGSFCSYKCAVEACESGMSPYDY
jgi:hypothetical protein